MNDYKKIGSYIADKRKEKLLTQSQLGERLGITYQAVSKWERGETLPDTAILLDLSKILETSVDVILNGGLNINMKDMKRVYVRDVKKGISSLAQLGDLIGKGNTIYKHMIEGVTENMSMEFETMLSDHYLNECLVAEILVQNIVDGCYVDASEVRTQFEYEHWKKVVLGFIEKHGLK
ncbi:helix-turn-helix transcriptional regulator [Mycoplasmatota bacterium WC44]